MLAFINDLLWSWVLIIVLVGLGLAFTIASRFVQFRYFLRMFRILRQAFHHERNHLSSFQALALSVAGRVGAGNIAGVAVAITLGGPGAVFWMWIIGLIGMATSYLENTLAQVYKNAEPDGTYRGGPAYYIQRGLGQKWMAALFSIGSVKLIVVPPGPLPPPRKTIFEWVISMPRPSAPETTPAA